MELLKALDNHISEIINIIGIIIGVILGWLLNSLSRHGRINIYPEWKNEFKHRSEYGSMTMSTNKEQAELYSYYLSFDVHNNSGEARIMRKIEVVFIRDRKELFRDIPEDDSTRRGGNPISFYDAIKPLTIPAKTVFQVKLHGGFWKDTNNDDRFKYIWDVNKIVLEYIDERNKKKRELIKDVDFNKCFENQSMVTQELSAYRDF